MAATRVTNLPYAQNSGGVKLWGIDCFRVLASRNHRQIQGLLSIFSYSLSESGMAGHNICE